MKLLLAAFVVTLTINYAGEIQWVHELTKVCLYKLPDDPPRFYWIRVGANEQCPATQEVQVDDSHPREKTRIARN